MSEENQGAANRVAEHFRRKIRDGELAPGVRLPPLRTIAEEHNVSPVTARTAMGWLRAEGSIVTTQRGSYVSDRVRVSSSAQDRLVRASRTASVLSELESARVLSASLVVPPLYVATDVFDLEPGDQVCRRESVTGRGSQRVMLAVDWYPATLAALVPALLSTARDKAGRILAAITEATGRTVTNGRDAVRARTADEREASMLGIKHGAPVLAGAHAWSDDQGLIVYGEWVLPEDVEVGWAYDMSTA